MDFNQALVAEAAGARIAWLLAAVVVATLLTRLLAPAERGRVRGFALLFVLSLLLLPVTAVLRTEGDPATYRSAEAAFRMLATLAAIGVLGSLLFSVVLTRLGVRTPRILQDVIVATAGVVASFVIASRAGFNISGLIATSTVLTAVIGLSLQDTLGNVMAGLALQMEQSLGVGQWIKIGDQSGRVTEMRWRATSMETRNGETLVIPNSVLVKNQFLVLGRASEDGVAWRRWVYFNVDFRYSPTEVIGAVDEILASSLIPRVARAPVPHCILMDLHESYARYAVRYWLTDLAADDPTDSLVRTRVYFALKRVGIPLSIPAQAVFVTEESRERKAVKSQEERQSRLAALARVEFFDHLAPGDRDRLADGLHYAPFAAGEVLTRQGAQAHWLYLVLRGEARVLVRGDEGGEREVARLGPGQFFGEMSLMTGAPRRATVVAVSDVVCYRLDKDVFQAVIRERPELAGRVAEILARRSVDLEAARHDVDEESRHRRVAEAADDLLGRMRRFFGLGEDADRS
jgi:small-conductance mechanosensitive channel